MRLHRAMRGVGAGKEANRVHGADDMPEDKLVMFAQMAVVSTHATHLI